MRKIDRNEYKEYLEFANECIANRVYPISIVTGAQDGDIYTDDKGCVLFWHYCGFAYISGNVSEDVLEEIIQQGRRPEWAHAETNAGSQKTALSVGFKPCRINTVIHM